MERGERRSIENKKFRRENSGKEIAVEEKRGEKKHRKRGNQESR